MLPRGDHRGIAVESPLYDERFSYAKEALLVVVTRADKVIKSIRPERSPGARYLDREGARTRLKPRKELFGRALRHLGGSGIRVRGALRVRKHWGACHCSNV